MIRDGNRIFFLALYPQACVHFATLFTIPSTERAGPKSIFFGATRRKPTETNMGSIFNKG